MRDPRASKLAQNLINYSAELQKGEKILIEAYGEDIELVKSLIQEAYNAGGIPFVSVKNNEYLRVLLTNCTKEQIKMFASFEAARMQEMDAYIGIRASSNINELSSVPSEKMKIYSEFFEHPVHHEIRVNKTKWCVIRYPNDSMSQLAGMPTDEFEDLYFQVCNLDYSKMSLAMDNLIKIMNATDKVRIISPATDLTFSIKDLPAIKCEGKRNIPDGEVYTAPVKDSVNGYISYNVPAVYQGTTFENIRLEFKDGKIIAATSNNTEKINKIFDTDEGARYVGEFSLGVNPYIFYPIKDTLFDEKICGSFHFTPGSCYEECNNGNKSAIHWDLVNVQRVDYGGGEIWFDDRLIRKDGLFVIDELMCLNPENLK